MVSNKDSVHQNESIPAWKSQSCDQWRATLPWYLHGRIVTLNYTALSVHLSGNIPTALLMASSGPKQFTRKGATKATKKCYSTTTSNLWFHTETATLRFVSCGQGKCAWSNDWSDSAGLVPLFENNRLFIYATWSRCNAILPYTYW